MAGCRRNLLKDVIVPMAMSIVVIGLLCLAVWAKYGPETVPIYVAVFGCIGAVLIALEFF